MKHSLLYSAFFIVFLQNCFSQTVSLDPTFGTGGKTTYSFSPSGDALNAIAIQEDNKILVSSLTQYSVNGNIIISRFNSDGTLDLTFGFNGIVETQLVNETGAYNLIKLQNDGKILVTGSKLNNSTFDSFDFATMRYNTDGSIDTFFGINGIVITDINGKGDIGSAVDVQSDNKIIVAGYSYLNTNQNAQVSMVRYLSNGTLDTTFGSNGKLVVSLLASNSYDYTQCIKVLSNDNILVGANTTALETLDDYHNFGVVKILSNGTVDTAFGNNGSVVTDFGAKEFIGTVNEFNGNIIAAGYSTFSGGAKMAIAKYTVNGTLDAAFGVNGIFYGNKNESTLYDAITNMKVLNSGKILCSGYTLNTTNADFLLIQFNVDGSFDTGFNSTGYFMTDFANTNDLAGSIDIGPDGKIVCAGLTMVGANYVTGLARYELTNLSNVSSIGGSFSVYPNPFTDFTTITCNETNFSNATIELYDISGRKILNYNAVAMNNAKIPIETSLTNGTYILKITEQDKTFAYKLVKE